MKCLCNVRCKYLKEIDMFGKDPELYYKGRSKKTSWPGRIFSVLFVVSYIAFFIYKVIRMMKKTDVTFYDTFTYVPEPSKVKVTKENFYGGFALEDPESYDVFIDEGIYIPKAFFKRAERKGESFHWDVVDLELERCRIENFGSIYQEKFVTKQLNNLYCFKNMDFYLEGHFSYDLYSFFYIQFFPCVNTSTKHDCKPLEVIDHYLKNTFISFQWQDIELTPKNYSFPIRPRDVDIYTTVGKKIFKEIHTYFQVVNIETDLDFIGFDEFENIKTDVYLKYDEMIIMSNLIESDIYQTGESFCDFTIKLSENVRSQRRTYTKLITILGDVGGLMEVVFTLFRMVSSFAIDILYDISLINNIFAFDIDKKKIIIKDKNKEKKNYFPKNDENPKIYNPKLYSPIKSLRKLSSQNTIFMNEEMSVGTKNRINEETKNTKLNSNNENLLVIKFQRKRPIYKAKSNYGDNLRSFDSNTIKNKNFSFLKKKHMNKLYGQDYIKEYDFNSFNNQDESEQSNRKIITKIKMTRACIYLCFCFTRKRKIIQNVLLDEGMNIISEKLDIFNIFDKIYRDELIHEKYMKHEIIEMSDECKLNLKHINTNLYKD